MYPYGLVCEIYTENNSIQIGCVHSTVFQYSWEACSCLPRMATGCVAVICFPTNRKSLGHGSHRTSLCKSVPCKVQTFADLVYLILYYFVK